MFKIRLTLTFLFASLITFAQETTLNNLYEFDKAIIKGNTSEVILSRQHHDAPSVIVDGAANKDIDIKIEAGVMYLTLSGNNNPTVEINNGKLKRIEGPTDMVVSNARLVGDNGKYLVMSIRDEHEHHAYSSDNHTRFTFGDIDIRIPDIDIDLDLDEDCDFEVYISDDFNFDFNFDFDFNNAKWQRNRVEFHELGAEVSEQINKAIDEVRSELDKMRKID